MTATRALFGFVLLSAAFKVSAIDWLDAPIVHDGACEFRHVPWTVDYAKKHGLRSTPEMQEFAIRSAQERCKNGMVLLISSLPSGYGPTREPTLNVARALCKVPDIQQATRPAFDQWVITDVRCVITKISDPTLPSSGNSGDAPNAAKN